MDEPDFVARLRGRAKTAMDQAHLEAARVEAARRDAADDRPSARASDQKKKRLKKPEPVLKPLSARRGSRRLQAEPASPTPARQPTARESYFDSLKARVRGEISNDNSLIREDFDRSAERG